MIGGRWDAALDDAASAVFGSEAGRSRLEPLLAIFDREVGVLLEEDGFRDLLLAMRLDWALCDVPCPGARDRADTWLRRAIEGELADVRPDPQWVGLLSTHAGLFEVWPAPDGAFLRDLAHGVCLTLTQPTALGSRPRGPAAIWDVRVKVDADGCVLCRAPLSYPPEALDVLREVAVRTFEGAPVGLLALRRAWLASQRQSRLQPARAFARALQPLSRNGR